MQCHQSTLLREYHSQKSSKPHFDHGRYSASKRRPSVLSQVAEKHVWRLYELRLGLFDELVIDPKRIEDVERFLKGPGDFSSGRGGPFPSFPRILLVTGPSGCGKETLVRVLCSDMGVPVKEWIQQADWSSAARGAEGGSEREPSKSQQFLSFLVQSMTYASVKSRIRVERVVAETSSSSSSNLKTNSEGVSQKGAVAPTATRGGGTLQTAAPARLTKALMPKMRRQWGKEAGEAGKSPNGRDVQTAEKVSKQKENRGGVMNGGRRGGKEREVQNESAQRDKGDLSSSSSSSSAAKEVSSTQVTLDFPFSLLSHGGSLSSDGSRRSFVAQLGDTLENLVFSSGSAASQTPSTGLLVFVFGDSRSDRWALQRILPPECRLMREGRVAEVKVNKVTQAGCKAVLSQILQEEKAKAKERGEEGTGAPRLTKADTDLITTVADGDLAQAIQQLRFEIAGRQRRPGGPTKEKKGSQKSKETPGVISLGMKDEWLNLFRAIRGFLLNKRVDCACVNQKDPMDEGGPFCLPKLTLFGDGPDLVQLHPDNGHVRSFSLSLLLLSAHTIERTKEAMRRGFEEPTEGEKREMLRQTAEREQKDKEERSTPGSRGTHPLQRIPRTPTMVAPTALVRLVGGRLQLQPVPGAGKTPGSARRSSGSLSTPGVPPKRTNIVEEDTVIISSSEEEIEEDEGDDPGLRQLVRHRGGQGGGKTDVKVKQEEDRGKEGGVKEEARAEDVKEDCSSVSSAFAAASLEVKRREALITSSFLSSTGKWDVRDGYRVFKFVEPKKEKGRAKTKPGEPCPLASGRLIPKGKRPPLKYAVEERVDATPCEPSFLVDLLFEHLLTYMGKVEDVAVALEDFSQADSELLRGESGDFFRPFGGGRKADFGGAETPLQTQLHQSLCVRGVLDANLHPLESCAPRGFCAMKGSKQRAAKNATEERADKLRRSARELFDFSIDRAFLEDSPSLLPGPVHRQERVGNGLSEAQQSEELEEEEEEGNRARGGGRESGDADSGSIPVSLSLWSRPVAVDVLPYTGMLVRMQEQRERLGGYGYSSGVLPSIPRHISSRLSAATALGPSPGLSGGSLDADGEGALLWAEGEQGVQREAKGSKRERREETAAEQEEWGQKRTRAEETAGAPQDNPSRIMHDRNTQHEDPHATPFSSSQWHGQERWPAAGQEHSQTQAPAVQPAPQPYGDNHSGFGAAAAIPVSQGVEDEIVDCGDCDLWI
uniref:Uncharacterized protein n=1 Tax=Chromera velia CCMP2878 TaxID=1169474 RepID=A0A0G4I3J7_9ALVE|eukprot:Cvel_10605.t1-p1 / transcript=Cvel_10605.t1 / gene=Cvel_10605 / organism=Chromera_velia_CCMP2878 / gene_product=hypothetical protein / transcript_product=hypothetical protein / location=Cvel_scaffold643:47895-55516(-) / protein_length=1222 / sequence_SO=supercontig / SO=protein_coding / is_pseudo=false